MTDDTRTRILTAAGPIFAEKGFQASTVREICDSAAVNLASVNYYFGDKEKLYIETVKLARQRRASQAPMPSLDSEQTAEERLKAFIHALLVRMIGSKTEPPWQFRLMIREIVSPSQACAEMVEEYFRPEFSLLVETLRGLLPRGTAESAIQQLSFSVVGQCLFYRVAEGIVALLIPEQERDEHYKVDTLAEHVFQVTLAAVDGHVLAGSKRDSLQVEPARGVPETTPSDACDNVTNRSSVLAANTLPSDA